MTFSLLDLFQMGGVFMWPLLIFSIAAAAIALDRFVYLGTRNLNITAVETSIFGACEGGDLDGARKTLDALGRKAPFAPLMLLAIDRRGMPEKSLEEILENEAGRTIDKLEAGFNFLTAIGSLAPLTGFLGTVSGMIGAFRSIAEATEVNAQIVANGIYEALITTVFGLIIAIIAMVSHSLLSHVVDTFSARLSRSLTALIIVLKSEKREESSGGVQANIFCGEVMP